MNNQSILTYDPLLGLRVLVVEDDMLVAMLIEEYLLELGCTIAASARRVANGLDSLADGAIDAAVLDINVAGESITPLAEALTQRRIPFVFASGYGSRGMEMRWEDRPMLQKPFTAQELRIALIASLRMSSR